MTYQLVTLNPEDTFESVLFTESALFIEGAVLASNFAVKPIAPEVWLLSLLEKPPAELVSLVTDQINLQYNRLKRSEYSILELVAEDVEDGLSDFAEGFMSVWPTIEEQWQDAQIGDGTLRMLQALLTTLMLAIDEQQTQQQMLDSGISAPPSLNDLTPQLDVMISEVALAADEMMIGGKSQSVNPFKHIGRNDPCPCGSEKKFKQCCGR